MGARAPESKRPPVWDCGSNLYDSFELKSFERRLDSAISSRSYSMPHDRYVPLPHRSTQPKKPSGNPKSIVRKLFRSFFRVKPAAEAGSDGWGHEGDAYRGLHPVNGGLPTILESHEKDLGSPAVGKSVSDRFTTTAARISCS
ncbi:unnamed protein product [Spirodela intermedia]|uniref:Uncharacterized protein n=2 Tax=Spirodela intermedia TaxID=51605 RepID=A0A7I8J743_SPIIN|nr:unnamed protein product [Spirodela intermedia]CAA6665879.1 unnamed protein product [Spirodela intermedia]CAA7402644.1 unnamed protein product [Spirodela intermedia]